MLFNFAYMKEDQTGTTHPEDADKGAQRVPLYLPLTTQATVVAPDFKVITKVIEDLRGDMAEPRAKDGTRLSWNDEFNTKRSRAFTTQRVSTEARDLLGKDRTLRRGEDELFMIHDDNNGRESYSVEGRSHVRDLGAQVANLRDAIFTSLDSTPIYLPVLALSNQNKIALERMLDREAMVLAFENKLYPKSQEIDPKIWDEFEELIVGLDPVSAKFLIASLEQRASDHYQGYRREAGGGRSIRSSANAISKHESQYLVDLAPGFELQQDVLKCFKVVNKHKQMGYDPSMSKEELFEHSERLKAVRSRRREARDGESKDGGFRDMIRKCRDYERLCNQYSAKISTLITAKDGISKGAIKGIFENRSWRETVAVALDELLKSPLSYQILENVRVHGLSIDRAKGDSTQALECLRKCRDELQSLKWQVENVREAVETMKDLEEKKEGNFFDEQILSRINALMAKAISDSLVKKDVSDTVPVTLDGDNAKQE